ncbi:Squalene monooxygenase [Gossypium australe]|uniref:Squalene monooxygenase n=1 Tax=Gossypium australe TaxID=47621 RepID=A0A5B6V8U9_9ROSI|nr:Squalene monooxygenase [Gossypium australe]
MDYQIPAEMKAAFISTIDKGNIRTMSNRSMHVAPHPTPGALLMGDAFDMYHPLIGGGMTVALFDIVVLKDILRPLYDLHDASALYVYLESFYTLRKEIMTKGLLVFLYCDMQPVVSTINTLAGALYKVFSASPDPSMKEMHVSTI